MDQPMVCPICNKERWSKKDWFNPQWQACSPIVDHCSGNYDRCKHCYYNTTSLVPTAANNGVDRKYDEYARCLHRQMLEWNKRCKPLEDFMLHWTYKNMHTSFFKDWGTVDCVTAGDPKQWLYVDRATAGKSYTPGSAGASTAQKGFWTCRALDI